MFTPKCYRQLGEILLQETNTQIPDYSDYLAETLQGRSMALGEYFRISVGGKLEATRPSGPQAHSARLQTHAVIRGVVRAAQVGIPIGFATKEWLQSALRAPDFQREAERCLRSPKGEK